LRQVFLRLAKVSRHWRPTSLAAGPGADLAFLDHVPQVGLAAVVVDRQVGALEHPQQFGLVALETVQDVIERFNS
jgi:hypothetical protein